MSTIRKVRFWTVRISAIFSAILLLFVVSFLAYWQFTLRPHIVAAGEQFVPPADFPDFTVEYNGDVPDGRLYFDLIGPQHLHERLRETLDWQYIVEIDMQTGQVLFAKKVSGYAINFHRVSDDTLAYHHVTPLQFVGSTWGFHQVGIIGIYGGDFRLLDNDYNRIGKIHSPDKVDIHELTPTEDGGYLYFDQVFERQVLPEQDCGASCLVLWQRVVEQTPDGSTQTVVNLRDHYHVDDMTNVPITSLFGGQVMIDVTHANSIAIDENDDLLISVRHFNEVIKVDRETGDALWHMGGAASPYNEFEFINDPLNGFSYQHTASWLENGNMLLFDNGNYHEPPISRAVEYKVDKDARTAELVWSYTAEDEWYAASRGSAQRLPDGSTLINWVERQPNIQVVSAEGDVLMEITLPDGFFSYRAQYYPY